MVSLETISDIFDNKIDAYAEKTKTVIESHMTFVTSVVKSVVEMINKNVSILTARVEKLESLPDTPSSVQTVQDRVVNEVGPHDEQVGSNLLSCYSISQPLSFCHGMSSFDYETFIVL